MPTAVLSHLGTFVQAATSSLEKNIRLDQYHQYPWGLSLGAALPLLSIGAAQWHGSLSAVLFRYSPYLRTADPRRDNKFLAPLARFVYGTCLSGNVQFAFFRITFAKEIIMTVRSSLLFALALLASTAHAQDRDRDRDRDREDRGDDIQLVCYGGAEKPATEVRNGFEWDARQHKYVPKQSVELGKSDFQATLNVSIHGDRGEIQIPRSLIPPLNSGGSNGWWNLDDLIVGHNEIRARFRLNGMNQPRVTINRRNGSIEIEGMIKFSGRCDADEGHRRF